MVASSVTVTSCATATGAKLSSTVTVTFAVAEFPDSSVPVNTTALAPKLLQSKLETSIDKESVQLSEDPLSTSAVVIVAAPSESKATVISCPTTVGFSVSTTVTVAVPVCTFPCSSVTLSVTVLTPLLAK